MKSTLDKATISSLLGPTKTVFPFRSDSNKAGGVFEFVASNSEVEWLSVTTGKEGSKETQTKISTDHLETAVSLEREMSDLVDKTMTSNRKILEIAHSHPIAQANYPSGFYPSGQKGSQHPGGGDRGNAQMVEGSYRKNLVLFKIYVGPTGENVYYNSKKIHR